VDRAFALDEPHHARYRIGVLCFADGSVNYFNNGFAGVNCNGLARLRGFEGVRMHKSFTIRLPI
jgi:hypothetical protein